MKGKVLIASLTIGCMLFMSSFSVTAKESYTEEKSFIYSYLESKSFEDYGLKDPKNLLENYSFKKNSNVSAKDNFIKELTTYRMNEASFKISSLSTENTINDIKSYGNKFIIDASSLVKIQFSGIDGLSLKKVNHKITLEKDNNCYIVNQDETHNDIYDYLLEGNKSYNEILLQEKKNTNGTKIQYLTENNNIQNYPVTLSSLNSLNRTAMGNYMYSNWNKRLTNWGNFDDYGGDCTNYASQVIYSGGTPMNTSNWYYYSYSNRAPAWTSVTSLYSFLVSNTGRGPRAIDSSLPYLQTGDLVQLSNGSTYYHTLLIVRPYGAPPQAPDYTLDPNRLDNITISSHTSDQYNYPLGMYTSDRRYIHLTGYSN